MTEPHLLEGSCGLSLGRVQRMGPSRSLILLVSLVDGDGGDGDELN